MKQKKREERLQRRRDDYDKNHATDAGFTRPGSMKKSAGGGGKKR